MKSMMKKLLIPILAVSGLVFQPTAHAQFTQGQSLTAASLNAAFQYTAPSTGAVTRPFNTKFQEGWISVLDFGADPTGTNPSATAIQNAINYACSSVLQKTVYEPPGVYLLDKGLNIAACDSVKLIGAGSGGNNDNAPLIQAPTINRWVGPSGGTALTISSGTSHTNHNGTMGIMWDGNNALGGIAVSIVSGRSGEYEIGGSHWSKTIVDTSISTTVQGNADVTGNRFYRIHGYQNNAADGSFLISEQSPIIADSCWNTFDLIQGNYFNSPAIVLGQNDNDNFVIVNLYQINNGTAKGIVIQGSNTSWNSRARNLTFHMVGTGGSQNGRMGGVYLQGKDSNGNALTYPPSGINILYLDADNAQAWPSGDPGTTVWFGNENAPIGDRQFYWYTTPSNGYVEVKASGVQRVTGQLTFNNSTSATFTFPTFGQNASAGFPTAITSITATPTTPVLVGASATSTVLTVTTSAAYTGTVNFTVEGY